MNLENESINIVIAHDNIVQTGFALIVNETRPEKQWVATGSPALEHNEYVKDTWPSNSRFNFFVATCADKDEGSCNVLEAKYIQRLSEIQNDIYNIKVIPHCDE